MTTKRIALTPGEPAGIGPELAVQLAQQPHPFELVCIASAKLLHSRATRLGLPLEIIPFDSASAAKAPSIAGQLTVLDVPLAMPSEPGVLQAENAEYVLKTLKLANNGCMNGTFQAVVTGPVQKSVINDSGMPFSGHTEFFAEHSGTEKVVMMLATKGLRVALATTHLPLKDVADAITTDSLSKVIKILSDDLRKKFGLTNPTILICGLNPHAGEGGHLGTEEINTIIPVMDKFREQGLKLIGPLPADTLFTPKYLERADAVLAMYHDQGLPVLKHKGFGKAVNITLGLPYIRTSVDHGTALDLAGQGIADTGSLEVALQYAYDMVQASQGSHD